MKTPFLALIAILLIGGGIYMYAQRNQANQPAAETSVDQATTTAPVTTTKLARDLATITPQFVDNGDHGVYSDGREYPDYIINIRKDLEMVPIFRKALDNSATEKEILLKAIGKRYVLVHMPGGKDMGADVVFDSETQQITDEIYWPVLLFKTDEFAVYVLPSDVCIYTLDQPECVSPPGAKLDSTSGEMYWDPMGNGTVKGDGSYMNGDSIKETHTATSITLDVLRWTPYAPNEEGMMRSHQEKVRDITFMLP